MSEAADKMLVDMARAIDPDLWELIDNPRWFMPDNPKDVAMRDASLERAKRAMAFSQSSRPVGGEAEPVAWMRRWAFDKDEGTKGNRPKGWALHATTTNKCLDSDVPLYTHPAPSPVSADMVVVVARAIAKANGDEFANAFKNKSRWVAKRGMSGGRYRDINEPYQSDYIDMAEAAITALRSLPEQDRRHEG